MQGREPSMEDILASIKKVIAEEKESRTFVPPSTVEELEESEAASRQDEDVLELEDRLAPEVDLGPPLLDDTAAGQSRQALEQLTTIAASVPTAPPVNPLEDMIREMLRPILKQWLD